MGSESQLPRYDVPNHRPCPQPDGPRTWPVWDCDACRPKMCGRLTEEGAQPDD